MARLPKLDHIKYVRAKGRIYAYFNTGQKVNGKPVYDRLPDPSSPHFLTRYQALSSKWRYSASFPRIAGKTGLNLINGLVGGGKTHDRA